MWQRDDLWCQWNSFVKVCTEREWADGRRRRQCSVTMLNCTDLECILHHHHYYAHLHHIHHLQNAQDTGMLKCVICAMYSDVKIFSFQTFKWNETIVVTISSFVLKRTMSVFRKQTNPKQRNDWAAFHLFCLLLILDWMAKRLIIVAPNIQVVRCSWTFWTREQNLAHQLGALIA